MALLSQRQTCRKLDLHLHNHVSPFVFRLTLTLRHAKMREGFSVAWRCGSATAYRDLLAIDGRYRSLPAGEGFFEVQLDDRYKVVVLAPEERVFFLCNNEMQILRPPLLLISHSFELHLRPSLVAGLDIHFQNLVLDILPLRSRIEGLPLNLHLLVGSSVQFFQCHW